MTKKTLAIIIVVIIAVGVAAGIYINTRPDNTGYGQYGDISVSEGAAIYMGVRGYDAGYVLQDAPPSGFWESQIDGVSAQKWVSDYTSASLERYLTIEALFDELDLSLTDDDLEDIENTVYDEYVYYGRRAIYGPMGVHEEDYNDIITNDKKAQLLLGHYRDQIQSDASEEDLRDILEEEYASCIYISMNYFDEEGESWEAEYNKLCKKIENGEKTVSEMAEDYAGTPGFSTSYDLESGRGDIAIASDNASFPKGFRDELFQAESGDIIFYDDSANFSYNIVQCTDVLEDDYFLQQLQDELYLISLEDDFEKMLREKSGDFNISINKKAVEEMDMKQIMAQA